jgi:hypothetical protein
MLSSYQVVLWKQESFGVLRPLQIEFFRNLLENAQAPASSKVPPGFRFSLLLPLGVLIAD